MELSSRPTHPMPTVSDITPLLVAVLFLWHQTHSLCLFLCSEHVQA